MENNQPKVAIIMGSDSDYDVMVKAAKVLKEFNVPFEMTVASAHRTTDRALAYAENAKEKGIQVIISGAGAAAHLPGVIAAKTTLPVIGVPINTTALNGVDALYAIVQMPSGIPVATVAIDGSKNAALLAVQILSLTDQNLADQFKKYKENMIDEVEKKNTKVQERLKNI